MCSNRLHPKRWTLLTWVAIVLWGFYPLLLNYPPSVSYSQDPETGEFTVPKRYADLSELDFPLGWPLRYVKPNSSPPTPQKPITVLGGRMAPKIVPSTIYPWAMLANVLLILSTTFALVYCLQKKTYQFTLRFLFAVMLAWPIYLLSARTVHFLFGSPAIDWYSNGLYFLPIGYAIALKFSRVLDIKLPQLRPRLRRKMPSSISHDQADDMIAAASKCEQRGDWKEAIRLFDQAAFRWPEHAGYAQNCIDRIREKQMVN